MLIVGSPDACRPFAQFGEIGTTGFVAQKITGHGGMVHKTPDGRFGILFQFGTGDDQLDADLLRHVERPLHRIGIAITFRKMVRDARLLEFEKTLRRRAVGGDAVPSQNRHFALGLQLGDRPCFVRRGRTAVHAAQGQQGEQKQFLHRVRFLSGLISLKDKKLIGKTYAGPDNGAHGVECTTLSGPVSVRPSLHYKRTVLFDDETINLGMPRSHDGQNEHPTRNKTAFNPSPMCWNRMPKFPLGPPFEPPKSMPGPMLV